VFGLVELSPALAHHDSVAPTDVQGVAKACRVKAEPIIIGQDLHPRHGNRALHPGVILLAGVLVRVLVAPQPQLRPALLQRAAPGEAGHTPTIHVQQAEILSPVLEGDVNPLRGRDRVLAGEHGASTVGFQDDPRLALSVEIDQKAARPAEGHGSAAELIHPNLQVHAEVLQAPPLLRCRTSRVRALDAVESQDLGLELRVGDDAGAAVEREVERLARNAGG